MKRLQIFCLIICCFRINAYQPAEHGIFLSDLDNLYDKNKKNSFSMSTNREVFSVSYVKEFLNLFLNSKLPIIINFYSKNNNQSFLYKKIAKIFKNKFLFASINKDNNEQLSQLLMLILKMTGRTALPSKLNFPIIIYCKPSSVLYKDGIIYFKKSGFKELIHGDFDKEDLYNKLNQLSQNLDNE